MADGVSRSTNGRSIGCFTVQARAGAENAFAPVAHSYTDSTPVLFLPGHPGSSFVGVSPSFESHAELSSHHQDGAKDPGGSSRFPSGFGVLSPL